MGAKEQGKDYVHKVGRLGGEVWVATVNAKCS